MAKLLFTGDSITDCGHMFEPEGLGNGYVRMLQSMLPEHTLINRGYDGYIASRVHRVWEEICIKHQPDVVTLLVGVNDLCAYLTGGGGYDAKGYAYYIEEILRKTREQTMAQFILMEPFLFPKPAEYLNWMGPLKEFQQKVRDLSAEFGTGFVPLAEIFQMAQEEYEVNELTIDGIHLTQTGHRILADAWLKVWRGE